MTCINRFGLSWTEAGKLRLADFDMLVSVGNEIDQAKQQQRQPSEPTRSGGVTRTPITQ